MVDACRLAASIYPPKGKHLWFQQKQVEADSQSMTELYSQMGIYTLFIRIAMYTVPSVGR